MPTDHNAFIAAAKDDYKPQLTALQQLQTSAGNLGNGNRSDNQKTIGIDIAAVGTTSPDLFTHMATCGS